MRTKIIATIGPNSANEETIFALAEAGVNIFRLNFSHGNKDFFRSVIAAIRSVQTKMGKHLTVLQDLSGPKIRIGVLESECYQIQFGDVLFLGTQKFSEEYPFIPFSYENLLKDLKIGDILVLADGALQFKVKECLEFGVLIESESYGIITSRKGLTIPHKAINMPAMTEKDMNDLAIGIELGVDAVALSFVQTPEDIILLRSKMKELGAELPVVSKLERQMALDNLDAIIAESDMIMVARGDLGVECSLPLLPSIQKRIIKACNQAAKPVIVATQMLLSMVNSNRPTRAEVTDVANAVLDGADCVMLSEETAMGEYPVETVRYMRQITTEAEEYFLANNVLKTPEYSCGLPEFLAYSACLLAEKANAYALVVHSRSGKSALYLSSCRPKHVIYALTLAKNVLHKMNFAWGITPYFVKNSEESSHLIRVQEFVDDFSLIPHGAKIVFTVGDQPHHLQAQGTNLVKIYTKQA